jgi:hypothetical protein
MAFLPALLQSLRKTAFAAFCMALGFAVGLGLLEIILRANPPLLSGLRGLGAPAPLDPPLTVLQYDVFYSDGDQRFWRPDLVRPVPPGDNRLESHVRLETDELGFRNSSPLPPTVDIVVLGRSFSLGAQVSSPWPAQLADTSGWKVLNLSQPGSGLDVKREYLLRYGLPRKPRWVVVEVQPPMDNTHFSPASPSLVSMIPIPFAQEALRRIYGQGAFFSGSPIYPLSVDLPGQTINLVCCIHYLEALTINQEEWEQSLGWQESTAAITGIAELAEQNDACTAVLYAPTKPEVFFPLAIDPSQLTPTLRDLIPLRLNRDRELVQDPSRAPADIPELVANAPAARDALAAYAREHHLTFIDPTARMVRSILEGKDPFMAYDSHWNMLGQALVAESVAEALQAAECP